MAKRIARRWFLSGLFPGTWLAGVLATGRVAAGSPSASEEKSEVTALLGRSFLWNGERGRQHNRFVAFRQTLEAFGPVSRAVLHVFADTRYVAYLNGRYLAAGPARFDPRFPEYDSLPLAGRLERGRNVLAILVQSFGAANGWSMAHEPGLSFVVEWENPAGERQQVAAGPDTRWKRMDAWDAKAPVGWPYAAEWLDARRLPAEWTGPEFDDSDWRPAVPLSKPSWGRLQPRSIPLLKESRAACREVVSLDIDRGTNPSWVWHDEQTASWEQTARKAASGPRYFRWRFEAPNGAGPGELRLAAGGDYRLLVNGVLVARKNVLEDPPGLIRFTPTDRLRQASRQVARYDLSGPLRGGENVLALEVHHHRYDTPTGQPGMAGILAQLNVGKQDNLASLASSAEWKSSERAPEGWEQSTFDDSGWKPVRDFGSYGVEPWSLKLGADAFRVAQRAPVVRQLPFKIEQRQRIVLDFAQVRLARPRIEMDAEPGAELEMIYAERIEEAGDPIVSFAPDRYIARSGRQTWETTDTRGFRFLVLRAVRGGATLLAAEATERVYAERVLGSFTCSDPELTELWPRSVETLRQCMEDAYIDTAWRERAQWLADTVACGFHVNLISFGDTALYRRMLLQIGQSQDEPGAVASDGWDLLTMDQGERMPRDQIEPGWVWAHYPSDRNDVHRFLEDYMLLWVVGIRDYYEQTLDREFVQSQWPRVERLLDWFHNHRTGRGLVKAREFVYFGNPVAYHSGEGATLNLFYLMALRGVEALSQRLGDGAAAERYSSRAGELETAIGKHLKQPGSDLLLALLEGEKAYPPSVHANVLALQAGVVPQDQEEVVLDWVVNQLEKGQELLSPYFHYWLFEMLYQRHDSERAERLVLERIRSQWGPILKLAAPTMPEFFYGGASTESSGVRGSVCHISGTAPAWVASSGVLGVRLVEREGSREIQIRPRLGDLQWARGRVPTTLGMVEVEHRLQAGQWRSQISAPQGAPAQLGLPGKLSRETLRLDGSPPEAVEAKGGALWMRLAPGRHVIEADLRG